MVNITVQTTNTKEFMKTLLHIWEDDQKQLHAVTDYSIPEKTKRPAVLEWENGLYLQLAHFLADKPREIRRAVTLIHRAATDTRLHYRGLNPALEKALTKWRRNIAFEKGIPAFMILNQKTLLAIADAAPISANELLNVPGVGTVIVDRYGEDILHITQSIKEEQE